MTFHNGQEGLTDMSRAYKECKKNWVSHIARRSLDTTRQHQLTITTDGRNERIQAPRRRREAQKRKVLVLMKASSKRMYLQKK